MPVAPLAISTTTATSTCTSRATWTTRPEETSTARSEPLEPTVIPTSTTAFPDLLFRNNGDGTFTDISLESGILQRPNGNGLGVVFGDYDNDGLADIYVANDSTPNFLFHNKGGGKFEEVGFLAGVAVGHDGKPQAGMGTDMGDFDGDGLLDIFVTNLITETHTLYRNLGQGSVRGCHLYERSGSGNAAICGIRHCFRRL